MSLTVTLKPGIMWTGNARVGIASRELTSADCAFTGNRTIAATARRGLLSIGLKIMLRLTNILEWDFNIYYANWEFLLVYGGTLGVPYFLLSRLLLAVLIGGTLLAPDHLF